MIKQSIQSLLRRILLSLPKKIIHTARTLLRAVIFRYGLDLSQRFCRWTRRPFESFLERVWEYKRYFLTRPISDGELVAILRRIGVNTVEDYLTWQKDVIGLKRNFIPEDRETVLNTIRRECPEMEAAVIHEAEKILSGEFDVLGSGPVNMRRTMHGPAYQLNWRKDPVSKAIYPRIFSQWRWDPSKMNPGNADMKGPWEIGRCQFFSTIGLAYWFTKDEKYAQYYAGLIMDFLKQNPSGFGIQYGCNMDVALRIVGWLVGFGFFQRSPQLTKKWWKCFLKGLVAHGRHIAANLEFGTMGPRLVASNHNASNLLGLYWLSRTFPALDPVSVWRGIAETGFEHEIQIQFLEDGGDFESSVPYHRLTLEIFLSAYAMSVYHGSPFSKSFRDKLLKALRVIKVLRQNNHGRQPQIGDADNGRAHILTQYGTWQQESMDHLLAAGAKVLNCPELAEGLPAVARMEALFWDVSLPEKLSCEPPQAFEQLPDMGLTLLRYGPSYVLLANSMVGTHGFGNHKHNDQLSIEWVLDGLPIIVDPGAYNYTCMPKERNRFRGTGMHNTVMVDNEEQNRIIPEWLFKIEPEGLPENGEIIQHTDAVGVMGRHTAYQRLADPLIHNRRLIVLNNGSLIVNDFFETNAPHHYRWHFLLHPNVRSTVIHEYIQFYSQEKCCATFTSDPRLRFRVESSWYSSAYGKRQDTQALVAEFTGEISNAIFIFQPHGVPVLSIRDAEQRLQAFWPEQEQQVSLKRENMF